MPKLHQSTYILGGLLLLLHVILSVLNLSEGQFLQNVPLIVFMYLLIVNLLTHLTVLQRQSKYFKLGISLFLVSSSWIVAGILLRGDSISTLIMGSTQRGDGLFFYLLLPGFIVSVLNLGQNALKVLYHFVFYIYTIIVLIGLVQKFSPRFLNPIDYDGVTGTFRNTNSAGAFYCLVGSALLLKLAHEKRSVYTYLKLFVLVTGLYLGISSKTIQAPAIILIVLFTLVILKTWNLLSRVLTPWSYKRISPLVKVLLAMSSLVFVYLITATPLMNIETFRFRQIYWESTISIIRNNWLFGIGPGNVSRYISEFRSLEYVEVLGANLIIDDPHNFFLSIILVYGVIPTLISGYIVFYSLKTLDLWRYNSTNSKQNAIAVGTAFIAYLNISYVSVSVIVFSILSISLLRISEVKEEHLKESHGKKYSISTIVLIICIVLSSSISVSLSQVPKTLSYMEAVALIKNKHVRCEIRAQILSQLASSDFKFDYSELLKVYKIDPRCSSISIAVMRFLILNGIKQDEAIIEQFYSLDSRNPNVVLIVALASKEINNLKMLIKYQSALREFTPGAFEKSDEGIREAFLNRIGSFSK